MTRLIMSGMEWLDSYEKLIDKSGYFVATEIMRIPTQQYYRLKKQSQGMKFKYLSRCFLYLEHNKFKDKDKLKVLSWIIKEFEG